MKENTKFLNLRKRYWSHENFVFQYQLQPFCDEYLSKSDRILIPGVGNDAAIVGMFDYGYSYLTAMDYAPEGIERCRGEETKDDIITVLCGNLSFLSSA